MIKWVEVGTYDVAMATEGVVPPLWAVTVDGAGSKDGEAVHVTNHYPMPATLLVAFLPCRRIARCRQRTIDLEKQKGAHDCFGACVWEYTTDIEQPRSSGNLKFIETIGCRVLKTIFHGIWTGSSNLNLCGLVLSLLRYMLSRFNSLAKSRAYMRRRGECRNK